MERPQPYEMTYSHSRRKHRHRCQCCNRIVEDGMRVVMWHLRGKTRVLHLECADKPSFDGITQRELAQLHSDEYARQLGYKVPRGNNYYSRA